MKTLKEAFNQDKVVKILWKLLNSIMALILALLAYYATDGEVAWAATVYPFAKYLSEILTRYINEKLLM